MKKSIGLLVLVGVIAAAAIFALRPAKPAPTQAAIKPSVATPPAPSPSSAVSAPEASPSVSLPAAHPATITPATPLVTTAAKPAAAETAAPTGTVTKNPKTLTELYRAFDAINAAAEAKTPESLASLVDFASTENSDVRGAALNAIINRDDASVAPLLRKAAKQLDDSKAIIALLETADYIELPSTTMTAIAARPKKPKPEKPTAQPTTQPPAAAPATPPASP
ncbi:MAG: hypothetical protein H7Y06_04515 [Opitutaceae bacterium]|nr:hypothetical protein [Opitutaceae bacterium]